MWYSHGLSSRKTISVLLTGPRRSIRPSIIFPSIQPPSIHPSIYSPHHKLFLRTLSGDTDSTSVGERHINKIVFLRCRVVLQSGRSSLWCRVSDIHAGSCWELKPCFGSNFGCTFIYFEDPQLHSAKAMLCHNVFTTDILKHISEKRGTKCLKCICLWSDVIPGVLDFTHLGFYF